MTSVALPFQIKELKQQSRSEYEWYSNETAQRGLMDPTHTDMGKAEQSIPEEIVFNLSGVDNQRMLFAGVGEEADYDQLTDEQAMNMLNMQAQQLHGSAVERTVFNADGLTDIDAYDDRLDASFGADIVTADSTNFIRQAQENNLTSFRNENLYELQPEEEQDQTPGPPMPAPRRSKKPHDFDADDLTEATIQKINEFRQLKDRDEVISWTREHLTFKNFARFTSVLGAMGVGIGLARQVEWARMALRGAGIGFGV